MVADPQVIAYQRQLAEVQAQASARRLAAFVDYQSVVCGLPLQPLTLRTYTLLSAWGNAFVRGTPVTFKDIVQFVWVHQPAFHQFNVRGRRAVSRRLWSALRPAYPTLNSIFRFLRCLPRCRFFRHLVVPTKGERYAAAIAEIRRIVQEATADFPPGSDDAPPAICSLTPVFVNLMIRGYGLDFAAAEHRVAHLPLKQLVQYLRETMHRLSKGQDKLLTAEESRIWSDYLGYKTQQAEASANLNRN